MLTSTTMSVTTASRRSRRGGRPLVSLGLVCAAVLLAPPAGGAAATSAVVKTTVFTGRIVSGTGGYASFRGPVRLVLMSSAGRVFTAPNPSPPVPGHYVFDLTLSAPPCLRPGVHAHRRCVSLAGKISGTAVAAPHNPDVGATFTLNGQGHVAPLGKVAATGSTSGLGFINRGRFPLSLRLRNANGSITIAAHGPLVPGFSSPF